MRKFLTWLETGFANQCIEGEVEVGDNATEEEIEKTCREAIFTQTEWAKKKSRQWRKKMTKWNGYIARDEDSDELWFYFEEPKRSSKGYWMNDENELSAYNLPPEFTHPVTWEDEPVAFELSLREITEEEENS